MKNKNILFTLASAALLSASILSYGQSHYKVTWLVSTNKVEYNAAFQSAKTATGVTGLAARKAKPATATTKAVLDGPFWAVNRGNKTVSLYEDDGRTVISTGDGGRPKILDIPNNGGSPTGIWFNPSKSFIMTNGIKKATAYFVAVNDDGSFWGWTPSIDTTKNFIIPVSVPTGSGYSGITGGVRTVYVPILKKKLKRDFLFATNFRLNQIDLFDGKFGYVTSWDTPADIKLLGLSVYNVYAISNNRLVVTYAKLQPGLFEPVINSGLGYAEVYDMDHNLIQRLDSAPLNSPWGVTEYHGSLLIGNFGDGRINSYDDLTLAPHGQLLNTDGTVLSINGLWALDFKLGNPGGDKLFWTAGPDHDVDGGYGSITEIVGGP